MIRTKVRFTTPVFTALLLTFLSLALPQNASADMFGVTANVCTNSVYSGAVTVNTSACDSGTVQLVPPSAVIGAGVEFTTSGGTGTRSIDFTNNTVSIIYGPGQGSPSDDLYVFSFTGLSTPILGLTLLTSNPLNVSFAFNGSAIGLLVGSPQCCTSTETTVTYQINQAVPEPGTVALIGIVMVGLFIGRQRYTAAQRISN